MNPALLRLLFDSVRGRIVRSARLIRQPRYLVGFLVFVLWMGMWAVRPALRAATRRSGGVDLADEALRVIQLGVALVLAVGLTLMWLLPRRRLSLGLSAAEIELLSSAPVLRRELIQYAIVKNQAGIVFGALIMALLTGVGGLGARLLRFVSLWLILTNGDLQGKGCSLFKARLGSLPAARARMLRLGALAVGAAFWAIVLGSVAGAADRFSATLAAIPDRGTITDFLSAAEAELGHGAHRVALAPLLWLLEPTVATLGASRGAGWVALSLLFGLGLVVAQNEWVVRSQFKFEESALEQAKRESAKKDPRSRYRRISHTRRTQSPFELRPKGAPGVGLLWKGMLQVRRGSLVRHAGWGAALALAVGLVPSLLGAPTWIAISSLTVGFVVLGLSGWIMPMHPRNDLHTDLLRLEVIRPWPLPGWQVFGFEVLAPAIEGLRAVGFGACLIVATDLGMQLGHAAPPRIAFLDGLGVSGPLTVPLLVLGLLPGATALSFLTATLINLAVLFLPGWVPLGPHKMRGAAAFGHNILLSLGLFLCHGVALGIAALLVAAILLVQMALLDLPFSAWELPLLGIVAALPAAVASVVGVRAGAMLWERLDASREVLDQAG